MLVEIARLVLKCLDLLDDVSRSRWEFNRARMELSALMAKLDPSINQEAQAGTIDGDYVLKTPTRTESQLRRQVRYSIEDDEQTNPAAPEPKRAGRYRKKPGEDDT